MLTVLRKNHTRTENLTKIVLLGEKYEWFTEGYKQSKHSVVLKCFFNLLHVKRHKKYSKNIFFVFFRVNLGLVLLWDFRKPYFDHISILSIQNWTPSDTVVLRKTIFCWFWKSPIFVFCFYKNQTCFSIFWFTLYCMKLLISEKYKKQHIFWKQWFSLIFCWKWG